MEVTIRYCPPAGVDYRRVKSIQRAPGLPRVYTDFWRTLPGMNREVVTIRCRAAHAGESDRLLLPFEREVFTVAEILDPHLAQMPVVIDQVRRGRLAMATGRIVLLTAN